MRLSAVLGECSVVHTRGDLGASISGITLDSRQVAPGFIFVAVRGLKMDGNRFIPDAIARGAAAIVSALPGEAYPEKTWIQVTDEREALAVLAANFYGHPAASLHAIGVTGTNGKTTTTYLIEGILKAAGYPSAVFGTIEYRGPGFQFPADRTTPEAPELQAMFRRVVDGGWKHAVMEVSSHAIELKRVMGLHFEVAVFTNLTRDHLDLHKDMRSYFLAKKKLFTGLDGVIPRVLVLNMDDPYFSELKAIASSKVISYGLDSGADVSSGLFSMSRDGVMYAPFKSPIGSLQIRSKLIGKPNLYNMGAAIATAIGLEIPAEAICEGIANMSAVPGRFESVNAGQSFRVIVDFAHTDDALTRVLQSAREITPGGRLIVVFGCGGDRDRTKRPLMGEVAVKGSDFAIVTSDNPRSEDPLFIISEVEVGVRRAGGIEGKNYQVVADRREAIRHALNMASAGDTVLLAGKGHEAYQIIGDTSFPFDERAVARELLDELATRRSR
jgi:UDP-N-acetylmuramoyl-L-alanyl-D-glutamate--2,6-diaminopimelate ligase